MEHAFIDAWNRLQEIEMEGGKIAAGTSVEGVPMIQLHIMLELFLEDSLHASELARRLGRAATSFTPILDKVEQRGWIQRKADPSDRRAIFICLTPKGEALRGLIEDVVSALNAAFGYDQIIHA